MKAAVLTPKVAAAFDNHHTVVRIENAALGIVGFIAIHRERNGLPSLGATRLWAYASEDEALRDALRLSRMMSYKLAFAGYPYGGAKAVLIINGKKPVDRAALFEWYAGQVNTFEGRFITGSDVGVDDHDLEMLHRHTSFVIGEHVPAGYYTALSVLNTIQAAMKFAHGTDEVHGKRFAVQGLGKTGFELLKLLHEKRAAVAVADINEETIARVRDQFPDVVIADPDRIFTMPVDVLSPCALGGVIDESLFESLRCKLLIGSANYPLAKREIASALHERGIVYGVDYIANSGGVTSVIDQYKHGTHDDARILSKLCDMQERFTSVLEESRRDNISPQIIADRIAEANMES